MMNHLQRILLSFASAMMLIAIAAPAAIAQQASAASFPLPQVPDSLSDFTARTDYVVEHYWDRANLKKKFSNKNAMAEALSDFLDLLPLASRRVALSSIADMMKQLEKNPEGMVVMVDRAIKDLYSDSAQYISDEVLLRFLKPALAQKKVDKAKKAEYQSLITRVSSSMKNGHVPMVDVTLPDGSLATISDYVDNDTTTIKILFLVDPADSRLVLDRARLSSDPRLNNLIDEGVFKFIALYPRPADEQWQQALAEFPAEWTSLSVPEGDGRFDLRVYPCIYIVDTNGFIRNKNLTVAQFLDWIYSL